MLLQRALKKIGLLVITLSIVNLHILPAQAAMVGTEQLISSEQSRFDRAQLNTLLDREDIQTRLSEMGVDPQTAKDRVARLTDAEVAELSKHLDDLPAGGDVLGVIVLFFLVFIITDVIGATDIFPFIRPVVK